METPGLRRRRPPSNDEGAVKENSARADVIILCGGMGTRLREETEIKPKPMVEIGGKPILWHIMKYYSSFGFNRFLIALGYRGEYIKKYFYDYRYIANDFTIYLDPEAPPRQSICRHTPF